MKIRNYILSGVLLILIGVMIGMILMFFRQGYISFDNAEVRITEVNRSNFPVWTDEELEKIDDRFVFRSVARSVTPTVVYIETIVSTRNRGMDLDSEEEDNFWRRFAPPRSRSVGSGVIITQDGYILTNNHVVEDAIRDEITITLEDKRTFSARVVGRDPSTDLAILKIDAEGLQSATIGNSDRVEVGEWVLAVGNPFRLRSTVTAGIISALSRDVQIINDALRIESFIQTDAAINRGNSGGALVNTSGELIGINTAIATQSGSYQGYGFAVPSNLALKVARDLIEFGDVQRGMLGVSIQSVNDRTARRSGLNSITGVEILDVSRDGAADKAGIRTSDIILKVNGETVNEANQLQEKVAMFRPNENVTLTLWRDREEIQRTVTLDELVRPQPVASSFNEELLEPGPDEWDEIPESGRGGLEHERFEDLGFTVRALATPEDPDKFNLYVHRVQRNSAAWNRGIREQHEIVEVNGAEVTDLKTFKNEVTNSQKNNRSLMLKIVTEGGSFGYFELN